MATVIGRRGFADTRSAVDWRALSAHSVVPLTLILALVLRLYLILRAPGILDGDEALVGIQAERIAAHLDHPFPVFFYGQQYMGSLEAYLAALVFKVVGPSVVALRMVPLVFSLALVVITYQLARRTVGRHAAVIAGVVAALAPLYPAVWSIKARGGYIETLTLGSGLLLVTHIVLYGANWHRTVLGLVRTTSRSTYGRWLVWGLLVGLLVWTSPLSVSYIVASLGTVAAFIWGQRRALPSARRDLGAWPIAGLSALVGVAVGGLPFWWANITSGGASFRYVMGHAGGSDLAGRVPHVVLFLVTGALPKLIGAWEPWGAITSPIFGVIASVFYLAAGIYLVARWVDEARGRAGDRGRPLYGVGMLLLCALVAALVFCLSGFGATALNAQGFDAASRYTLPLMSVLPIAAGALIWRLWRLRSVLGGVVLVAVLFISLIGVATARADSVFQSEYWAKLPPSQTPLLRFLDRHGIRDVWMNHWAGYPLMFAADNRITAYDYFDVKVSGGPDRLPWAYQRVLHDPHAAYVLVTTKARPPLVTYMETSWGIRPKTTRVGPYLIVWGIPPYFRVQGAAPELGYAY